MDELEAKAHELANLLGLPLEIEDINGAYALSHEGKEIASHRFSHELLYAMEVSENLISASIQYGSTPDEPWF